MPTSRRGAITSSVRLCVATIPSPRIHSAPRCADALSVTYGDISPTGEYLCTREAFLLSERSEYRPNTFRSRSKIQLLLLMTASYVSPLCVGTSIRLCIYCLSAASNHHYYLLSIIFYLLSKKKAAFLPPSRYVTNLCD